LKRKKSSTYRKAKSTNFEDKKRRPEGAFFM
jgi:hypothetical protein